MSEGAPQLLAINHDDYHAKHVGHTSDGRQFFLTTPFVPGGSEFVALYLFDAAGKLIEAKIDDFGPRPTMDSEAAQKLHEARLAELGEVTFDRIEIAPFAVAKFGITFGLIPSPPEADDEEEDEDDWEDEWTVELQPGNYMAFAEPWDSGDYET